jgi:quinol monooxygenase YgiN
MPNALLTVIAELVAKPGKEDELRGRLLGLVEPTRKEDGCVQYDLHQSTSEAGRFVFFENWRSPEALERHTQTPHMLAFGGVRDELLAEPARVLICTRIA